MSLAPHVAEYFDRVDVHVPTLPDKAARKHFLARETEKWQERYRSFAAKAAAKADFYPGTTAFDYATTIAELNLRYARVA